MHPTPITAFNCECAGDIRQMHGQGKCNADNCCATEKSKEREKRILACQSPGCSKEFHAVCIGHSKSSDKEISNMFLCALDAKCF